LNAATGQTVILGRRKPRVKEVKQMAARERAGRIVALAASIILMLMATAPAWAATLVGTAGVDQLMGTRNADTIYGLSG
jgi:hypothetical protein